MVRQPRERTEPMAGNDINIVLLTGGTGFLGGAAGVEILLRHPGCRILFLVRDRATETAETRLRRSLSRFADSVPLDDAWLRCEVIRGDLTDPQTLTDPRLDQVTHVLHLAANTSFLSVRGVRHTNILGTLTLAHRMRRVAGLRRFLHVSTAYICGAHAPPLVHEDDHPRPDARHLAEYTASKAETELLLERTCAGTAARDCPTIGGGRAYTIGLLAIGEHLLVLSCPGPAAARARSLVPVQGHRSGRLRGQGVGASVAETGPAASVLSCLRGRIGQRFLARHGDSVRLLSRTAAGAAVSGGGLRGVAARTAPPARTPWPWRRRSVAARHGIVLLLQP